MANSPSFPARGWGALLAHWTKDVQLWLYILATLQIFRLALIAVFHEQAAALNARDLGAVLFTGLRFDLSTAAMWVLPTFLLSLAAVFSATLGAWIALLRRGVGYIYVALAMFAFGADLVYFNVYNDQFNQHIFGLIHDDTTAILITVWKDYHPIPVLLGVGALIWLNLRLLRRWLAHTPSCSLRLVQTRGVAKRALVTLGVFLFLAAMGRGGTLWAEPILLKHAFVVDDLFLNRTVINPFTAFAQAVETKVRAELTGGAANYWPKENLRGAIDAVRTARGLPPTAEADVDTALRVEAHGAAQPPQHVFLVLLESHDGWTVMPAYRDYGFSPALSQLADKGLYFPNFLPSAAGTVGSMNALITGMPETGLNINYEGTALKPYPSAIAETFRRLGYRTRFFYGGFLGWQRLDNFAMAQGFDEVWGGGSMARDGAPTNEWGVADEYLFDFILNTVEKDEQPSFNFILTTSNHPPYDIDLEAEGFPIKELPKPLTATKADTLHVLGHLWYTDRELGRFVANAEHALPKSLFAITGDHSTRLGIRFPGKGLFEQVTVPFVLYGPQVLENTAARPTAGSHLDIPSTLIELSAPKGFPYYTFGQDLLSKNSPSFGLGYQYLVGEGFMALDADKPAVYPLPGGRAPKDTTALLSARHTFNALRALGWHRVRNGAPIP